MTLHFDYDKAPYVVPAYKSEAHRGAWDYLSKPGSWWTAEERIAIADTSREAQTCPFCADRKAALSPVGVTGIHNGTGSLLTAKVIDAAHRITTDSARLTKSWVDELIDDEFGYGHYVEMVGIIVAVISIDTFHRALDLPLEPLPAPENGEPDGYWPAGAEIDVAWVPMIYPANLSDREADIYFGAPQMGHVIRAMSLVPDAVRWLSNLSEAHYLPTPQVMDFSASGHLSLTRPQIELLAARTSILNDCFY